jgi:prefoldin subunit 5
MPKSTLEAINFRIESLRRTIAVLNASEESFDNMLVETYARLDELEMLRDYIEEE